MIGIKKKSQIRVKAIIFNHFQISVKPFLNYGQIEIKWQANGS